MKYGMARSAYPTMDKTLMTFCTHFQWITQWNRVTMAVHAKITIKLGTTHNHRHMLLPSSAFAPSVDDSEIPACVTPICGTVPTTGSKVRAVPAHP